MSVVIRSNYWAVVKNDDDDDNYNNNIINILRSIVFFKCFS